MFVFFRHIFHRTCIDPWLLDHRTCPMCKLDVIKALGYWVCCTLTFNLQEKSTVQEARLPVTVPNDNSCYSCYLARLKKLGKEMNFWWELEKVWLLGRSLVWKSLWILSVLSCDSLFFYQQPTIVMKFKQRWGNLPKLQNYKFSRSCVYTWSCWEQWFKGNSDFFSYSLSVFVYASTYAKCFIPVSGPVLRTVLKTFIRNWLNRENDVLSFLPDSTRKERWRHMR